MNRKVPSAGFLLVALMATIAGAMGGDIEKGRGAAGHSNDWPKGLLTLLDLQPHEGGAWVNANTWYWFAGDTTALNRFLAEAAKIDGATLAIRLNAGQGQGRSLGDERPPVPIDWKLSILRREWADEWPKDSPTLYLIRIDVWTGGRIDAKALEVPRNIHAGDTATTRRATTRPTH